MTDPLALLYAASALAVGTGWALAAREPRHRPMAAVLTLGLAGDLLTRLLRPAGGWAHPLDGAARAGFHLAQVLLAGYPFAVLASALLVDRQADRLDARRAARAVAAGAGAYLAGLVALYRPLALWDGRLGRVYLGAQVGAVIGLVAVAWRWWRARARPDVSQVVILWLAGVEVMNLAGPYALGFSHWSSMARAAYALSYVVVTCIQGVEAWRRWARSAG